VARGAGSTPWSSGSSPGDQCLPDDVPVDTSLALNRRGNGRRVELPIPWYGAGMSFGSISEQILLARAKAAKQWRTFTSSGEGGYPESLHPYREHVITQIATGMFGVREETMLWAPMIELKYAQGAKPGLGGHLLGDKTTVTVAAMRETVPWVSLFPPSRSTASTRSSTTESTSTGREASTLRHWWRSRSPRPPTSTWSPWAATTRAPTFSR
jgi:Conserved region in glutamate synthase